MPALGAHDNQLIPRARTQQHICSHELGLCERKHDRAIQTDIFRAQPQEDGASRCIHAQFGARDAAAFNAQHVHARTADELRGKLRARNPIDVERRGHLLDAALAQQHHLIGHAHRFRLVVRHVDNAQPKLLLKRAQFVSHLLAQLCIKIGERFVHQA